MSAAGSTQTYSIQGLADCTVSVTWRQYNGAHDQAAAIVASLLACKGC